MSVRFGSVHANAERRLLELVRVAGEIVDVAKAHGATIDALGVVQEGGRAFNAHEHMISQGKYQLFIIVFIIYYHFLHIPKKLNIYRFFNSISKFLFLVIAEENSFQPESQTTQTYRPDLPWPVLANSASQGVGLPPPFPPI